MMVESGGRAGLVNMYDGCGATCGLHQAVAVYPKNMGGTAQGPLWDLLWRLDAVINLRRFIVYDCLAGADWKLTGDGLVHTFDGTCVSSNDIRNELTPGNGKVPKEGAEWEHSKEWAIALSKVFEIKEGLGVQTQFGIEHMQRSARRIKIKVRNVSKTIDHWCYKGRALSRGSMMLHLGLDLAMCLFWCNFINGPRPAKKALELALNSTAGPEEDPRGFARTLITRLGNNSYGRWDDDIPNGRYSRAWEHATKVWPLELLEHGSIMPQDLPG
jgi:hypothetical protein